MNILYLTMSLNLDCNDLYCDLIHSLIKRGHSFTIVRSNCKVDETVFYEKEQGLHVLDVKTGNPFNTNLIKKGLNQILLSSFFKKAIKKYLSDNKYDLILYATPPITLACVIKYCKRKYGAKSFLMLKDIFPQNAVDLGMIKRGSLIYKYFRRVEKEYYSISDYIGCMSQGNVDFVISNNPQVDINKLHVFPNSIKITNKGETLFNGDKTVFIFGGNLGKPQNISFLLDLSLELKTYNKAEFLIIGDGADRYKITDFIIKYNPTNLVYKNRIPQEEYEQILKTADVGLISLDPRFTIPNVPSRFQSYLKLKKPIFALTDSVTDIRTMIENNDCGWWCEATDVKNAATIVKSICESKELQKHKGLKGFEFLKREFDVELNADKIENFVHHKE